MATSSVLDIGDRQVLLSMRRLADAFDVSRDLVAKRLAMHGVQPASRRHGHPVFRLRDAAIALVGSNANDADGNPDPRRLPPQERNAWYQSEARRLDVELSLGQLIPAQQHEADLAEMAKDLSQFLETLPDAMERDCALSPEQVDAMHSSIATQRDSLYRHIVESAEAEQSEQG